MDVVGVDDRGRASLHERTGTAWKPVDRLVFGVHGSLTGDQSVLCRQAADGGLPGPWATIAVDGARMIARVDHVGAVPLFWANADHRTVVATSLPVLLDHLPRRPGPNIPYLMEWSVGIFNSVGETAWHGVHVLPAGCCLESVGGRVVVSRYWTPMARLDNTADLAAWTGRLTRAFSESLQRSASSAPTAVQCSGGLDSSIVAGWAAADGPRAPSVLASVQYPGMPNDEARWQCAVADATGTRLLAVTPQPFDPDQYLARLEDAASPVLRPEPEVLELYRRLVAEGVVDVLTGLGGDELFAPLRWGVEEMVLQGRWHELARWWRTEGATGVHKGLRRRLSDLRPPVLDAARARRRLPPWVTAAGAAALGTRHLPPRALPGRHATGRVRAGFLVGGHAGVAALVNASVQRRTSIRMHHPFQALPLIEAALGIPGSLLHTADDLRWLQRQVFAAHLPAVIMQRRDKVHFDYRYGQHLMHPWVQDLMAHSALVDVGLLDGPSLARAMEEVRGAVAHDFTDLPSTIGALWCVVGIESWWRRYVR